MEQFNKKNIEFRINIEEKYKIEKAYDKNDTYILGEPRWLLITFNT